MANDVKWIKIVTDIFDDDKMKLIDAMPEADTIIVIWFKLLAQAGSQQQWCSISIKQNSLHRRNVKHGFQSENCNLLG